MTKENPHKVEAYDAIHCEETSYLHCTAFGCRWMIGYPGYERHDEEAAWAAAQEHIDLWNLRETNAGHAALIAKVSAERDTFKRERDEARREEDALRNMVRAGILSDGFHTHNELYEHRMMLNAHAVLGWLAAGYTVVKSWKHSDGEPCFGGGWFVVVATLPSVGQISYHYQAQHWDLFDIDEVETPPAFDGHTPEDVVDRLRSSLDRYSDATVELQANVEELGALHAAGVDNWQGYEIAMEEMENNE